MSKAVFKKLANKLKNPVQVQTFLRSMNYNHEKNGETLRSAHAVLKTKQVYCLEAALLAAVILEYHGYPPLVMSLESHDNLDYVIYVYQKNNWWGLIGCFCDEGFY